MESRKAQIGRWEEAILEVCPPGRHTGEEAQRRLNAIAKFLYSGIAEYCGNTSKESLLDFLYDNLDAACYKTIKGVHWKTGDKEIIEKIEIVPSILTYLINLVLLSESKSVKEPQLCELESIVQQTERLIRVSDFSSFLFYSSLQEGFKLTESGDFSFVQSEAMSNLQNRMLEKVRQR